MSVRAYGLSVSLPANVSASTAMCSIISGPPCRAAAAASMCTTAQLSNILISQARRGTRRYGKDEFKVHDLENLGDREMVFMTVEFKDSANKPMPLPAGVRPQSAAA